MGRMIFDLTDEDRDALEVLRVRMGLRSHAETLRKLIRNADTHGAVMSAQVRARVNEPQELPDVRAKAPIPPKASLSGVQFGPTPRAVGSGLKPEKGRR